MMIQPNKERLAQSAKKALASAFVLAAMSASFLVAGQQPAHAQSTFTVDSTGDFGDRQDLLQLQACEEGPCGAGRHGHGHRP